MSKPEGDVSAEIRLKASEMDIMLFRNNTGVGEVDGRIVRFGLANDSAQMNRRIKSSDLIGIMPDGRFVACECKREDWKFRQSDARAVAQKRFIDLIRDNGGVGGFGASVDDFVELIKTGKNRHG